MQRAAVTHLRGVLLRYSEIHINRIERLQRHDRITRCQILTKIDLSDSQDSGKRRTNHLALDGRLGLGNVSFRLLLLGYRRVEIGAGDYSSVQQLLHAVEIGFRQIALRFQGSQLSAFLTRIQFNQNISLMHVLAGIEQNLVDRPRQIGAYCDAVHRFHGANHAHSRWPGLLMRHDARHCLRRRLEM